MLSNDLTYFHCRDLGLRYNCCDLGQWFSCRYITTGAVAFSQTLAIPFAVSLAAAPQPLLLRLLPSTETAFSSTSDTRGVAVVPG